MRHVDNFFAEKSRVRTTTCTAFFEHYRGKDHGVALFKPHGSEGRRAGNKVRELLRFFDRCEL